MAQIPTYDAPQVEERPLPAARQESVASPGLFSGAYDSQAHLAAAVSDTGNAMVDVLTKMQERENDDVVGQAEVALKRKYLDKEAEVRQSRQGAFAKGITNDTKDWWETEGPKATEGLNPQQAKMLRGRMAGVQLQAIDSAARFEAQQLDVSQTNTYKAQVVSETENAAAHPESAVFNIQNVKGLNADFAARKGWTPEQLAAQNAEDITRIHEGVIRGMVDNNPSVARAYYAEHKQEINGTHRDDIEKLLKVGTAKVTAQTFTDKAMSDGLSLADALTKARKDLEGDDEEHTVQEIKTRYAEHDIQREKMQRNAADGAWAAYAKSGRVSDIPASVWNELDGKDQFAIKDDADRRVKQAKRDALAEANLSERLPKTNWDVYYQLRTQALADPDTFRQQDLRRAFPYLGAAARESLIDLQGKKPDELKDAATLESQLGDAHDKLKLKVGEQRGVFDIAVKAAIDAQEHSSGKKVNFDERQKIIDRMMTKGEVKGGALGGLLDPNKAYYQLTPSEKAAFVPDISDEMKAQIVQSIKDDKKPVTKEEIIYRYKRRFLQ